MTDAVLQRLIAGRAKIAKGWTKGRLRVNDAYSARGAVLNDEGVMDDTGEQAVAALTASLPGGWGVIGCGTPTIDMFNDEYFTSQGTILLLYDRAIGSRQKAAA
jgi:hypothetical protein